MGNPEQNSDLERLYRESGWTLRQFAQAANRVGTEQGTPLRYREPSAHQWLAGHMPRKERAARDPRSSLPQAWPSCLAFRGGLSDSVETAERPPRYDGRGH
jgi:hypothetical protein